MPFQMLTAMTLDSARPDSDNQPTSRLMMPRLRKSGFSVPKIGS